MPDTDGTPREADTVITTLCVSTAADARAVRVLESLTRLASLLLLDGFDVDVSSFHVNDDGEDDDEDEVGDVPEHTGNDEDE